MQKKAEILEHIKNNPDNYQDLDDIYKKDKDVALQSLSGGNGFNLFHADVSLQNDKDLMLVALKNNRADIVGHLDDPVMELVNDYIFKNPLKFQNMLCYEDQLIKSLEEIIEIEKIIKERDTLDNNTNNTVDTHNFKKPAKIKL